MEPYMTKEEIKQWLDDYFKEQDDFSGIYDRRITHWDYEEFEERGLYNILVRAEFLDKFKQPCDTVRFYFIQVRFYGDEKPRPEWIEFTPEFAVKLGLSEIDK